MVYRKQLYLNCIFYMLLYIKIYKQSHLYLFHLPASGSYEPMNNSCLWKLIKNNNSSKVCKMKQIGAETLPHPHFPPPHFGPDMNISELERLTHSATHPHTLPLSLSLTFSPSYKRCYILITERTRV